MPVSRLRIRLSAAFALAFALGLTVLIAGVFLGLRRDADRSLTRRLQEAATEVADALSREYGEARGAELATAARETFREWPATGYAFVVYDGAGEQVAAHGTQAVVAVAPSRWSARGGQILDRSVAPEFDVRLAGDRLRTPRSTPFRVIAIGSLQPTEEHVETLGWWMAACAPVVALLSLAGGYVLARHALRPIGALERTVAALDPGDLSGRLPVGHPADELDRLAIRFNELLDRLAEAQVRNRRFVRQAAHQLKTPLTVVLGEATLELSDAGPPRPGMRRVHAAAQQMRRRVDELLLLAEAQAGEPVALEDQVELDGLALECADLMRGRAAQTGHALTLGEVEAVTVRGSDRLLREALVELIENACRHGGDGPEIRVSVFTEDAIPWLEVAGRGRPVAPELINADPGDEGVRLGLTIVRWIAKQHGGRLRYRHADGLNLFGLSVAPGAVGTRGVA